MAPIEKIYPSFDLEKSHNNNGCIVGIDEAGCGPWAGPVVAGAVVFLHHDIPEDMDTLIRDSKTLTANRREKAYDFLLSQVGKLVDIGWGQASVEEIDTHNILQATLRAMERAVQNLSVSVSYALVDGNRKPNLSYPFSCVIKGDQRSYSIAAASIIAKVIRDRMMAKLDQEYPLYDWKNNAGYGTPNHQRALKEYGITRHHRRSFAPIRQLCS